MHAFKPSKLHQLWLNDGTTRRPYHICRTKADVLWLMGRWQESEPIYRRNVAWAAASGDPALASQSLTDLGWVLSLRGGAVEALELLGRAEVIFRHLGDDKGLACALRYSGNVLQRGGDSGRALEFYLRSLAVSRRCGDEDNTAGTLNSIGNIESQRGDYQGALDSFHQALEIQQRLGSSSKQAVIVGNIGVAYGEMRDFGKAMSAFQRVAALSSEAGDKLQQAAALGNMTVLHFLLGEYPVALENAQQRIAIAHEIGDDKGRCISLSHLGMIHAARQDHDQAMDYLEQAIAIARIQGIHYFLKDFLVQMAESRIAARDPGRADIALSEARTLASQMSDAPGLLKCRKLAADIAAFTDPGTAASQLEALLPEVPDQALQADIHAALFTLKGTASHRETAAALYRTLFEQTRAVEFAEKLDRLLNTPSAAPAAGPQ